MKAAKGVKATRTGFFCAAALALVLAGALVSAGAAPAFAEEIAGHVHSYVAVVTAPTCTEGGYTTYTCSGCDESADGHFYTADETAATGHSFSGNVCTACGALKETSVAGATVTFSKASYTYNGLARRPAPTVVVNGTTLKKGTDYTLDFADNTDVGTATVRITGTGAYEGTATATFDIVQKNIASSASAATVTLSKSSYTYNGKSRVPTPTVKITLNSARTKLTKGTDYTVSYKNNKKIGTATVTIKGTGNFKGTLTKTFKIVPKQVSVSSVISTNTGTFTVSWAKVSGGVSYQIYYKRTTSSTWSKKNVTSSTLSKGISGLKSEKTYQVKVRAYKKVSGKTYYGEWSSTSKVKTLGSKIVYLTFDDGPAANMGRVLDILDEYDVKATFFVGGGNSKYRYLITRAYEEGHAIGLHSYTHTYSKIYASQTAFFKDLKKIQDLVEDLTGEKSYLLRFPGGSSNTVSRRYCKGIMSKLVKAVEAKGYTYFDWNVDSTDASGSNIATSTIISKATTTSYKKINLLMHCSDSKATTVKALPSIIKYYKKKGYSFAVLNADAYVVHHGTNN